MLLQNGAPVGNKDFVGITPSQMAKEFRARDVIKVIEDFERGGVTNKISIDYVCVDGRNDPHLNGKYHRKDGADTL